MTIKLTDSGLKKSLQKDGRMQMYFLAGNDAFLISACKKTIQSDVGGEFVSLDFQTALDEEVAGHLATYSFEPKTLILENFKPAAYTEEKRAFYTDYLSDLPYTLTVIVTLLAEDSYGKFSIPKAAEAFCSLCPRSALVTCIKKAGGDLIRYVDSLARRLGCTLDYGAADRIIQLCGDDLLQISSQMEIMAAASNYGRITVEIAEQMCPKTTEEGVFDLVRAMERGRTAEAVRILYEMIEKEPDYSNILAVISGSFVNIARAKAAVARRISRDEVETVFGYKKNDKALSIAFDRTSRYSDSQISAILDCLYQTDRRLKKNAGDKMVILEQGLVRLAMLVSGRERV